jgi:hypothetical protein
VEISKCLLLRPEIREAVEHGANVHVNDVLEGADTIGRHAPVPQGDQFLSGETGLPAALKLPHVLRSDAVIAESNQRIERQAPLTERAEIAHVLRRHAVVAGAQNIIRRQTGDSGRTQVANEFR